MQRLAHFLLIGAVVLGACGSGDDVTVADAWARASAPTQTLGAVYFDLTVAEDDTLVGASVPPSVAARAEIHEVVTVDDSGNDTDSTSGSHDPDTMDPDTMDMDTMDMDTMDMEATDPDDDGAGMTTMRELSDGLALGGGETVSFEPGSYHVMLPGLVEPLEVGDEFELTLEFASADAVTVNVEVAESSP